MVRCVIWRENPQKSFYCDHARGAANACRIGVAKLATADKKHDTYSDAGSKLGSMFTGPGEQNLANAGHSSWVRKFSDIRALYLLPATVCRGTPKTTSGRSAWMHKTLRGRQCPTHFAHDRLPKFAISALPRKWPCKPL